MDQQEAKKEILARIKAGKPASQPLPDVPTYPWPGDPTANFLERLIGFDGRAVKFRTRDDAVKWLKTQPEVDLAKRAVYSSAEGFEGNVSDGDLADLRQAGRVYACATEGELGVGEMGSIWVTDQSLKRAPAALLCRRLFVFLDAKKIIGGLHEAYASLKLGETSYGSFFTGPSATADIEAVHITGAQGPLSFTALLYNCEDAPETPELLVNPNADSSVWVKDEEE